MATKEQTPIPCRNIAFQLNANSFVRTGYTFRGWNTDWNATTVQYSDLQTVTFDGDRDLYALWRPNTYKVRFNANTGTGSMSDQNFTYDVAQSLSPNTFGKVGHTYLGWGTSTTSGKVYDNQQSVINLTDVDGAIVTLYAAWRINQYTATFNHNDGTGNTTVKT